jgi:hypothetical protein
VSRIVKSGIMAANFSVFFSIAIACLKRLLWCCWPPQKKKMKNEFLHRVWVLQAGAIIFATVIVNELKVIQKVRLAVVLKVLHLNK